MPRGVLYTTAALVLLAALGGVRLGLQQADLADASGLIERVARQHVQEHGGDISACMGWLTEDGALLNVRCGDVTYQVDEARRIRVVPEHGI